MDLCAESSEPSISSAGGFLRLAEKNMPEHSDRPIIVLPGPDQKRLPGEGDRDRRLVARFPFTASAEVVEIRSQARVVGRSSDLGVGGCYVDTLSPFSVGATVRVRLERDEDRFEAEATVIYAHLSMGMGLVFTKIRPEHQAILQKWIAELSGDPWEAPELPAVSLESGKSDEIANLHHFLAELVNLMVRRKLMSDMEAEGFMRQLFR